MAKKLDVVLDTAPLDRLLRHVHEVVALVNVTQRQSGGTFTVWVEDGRDVDTDKTARSNKAFVARELLRAQGVAELLGTELGVMYQQIKGSEDPREVEPDELA